MSYTQLQADAANWLNRTDLTDSIPSFIVHAEASLNRRLRTRDMLTVADLELNAELVDLPSDYEEWRSFAYESANGMVPLEYLSPDRANLLHQAEAAAPTHFTIEGNQVRLIPAPDDTYTGRLLYYAQLEPLSATVSTNWLRTKHPDIYLYATLVEAGPYLRDPERLLEAETQLERRMAELTGASVRSEIGGGPLKPRARRGFD